MSNPVDVGQKNNDLGWFLAFADPQIWSFLSLPRLVREEWVFQLQSLEFNDWWELMNKMISRFNITGIFCVLYKIAYEINKVNLIKLNGKFIETTNFFLYINARVEGNVFEINNRAWPRIGSRGFLRELCLPMF